ncbi:hypothetical protein GCM10028820_06160 [Tessaracoccus terricola]
MNKMIKGAAVAGLGVALLLGGAGTLAVWNDAAESNAGAIVAGDLEVTAGSGQWESNLSGVVADIAQYRVIPGETLTYSQVLDVVLVGDELEAVLSVTGTGVNKDFKSENVEVSEPTLTNSAGEVLPTTVLTEQSPDEVTASVSFVFKDTTSGRDSVTATYDFSGIGFLLEQQAPTEN